MRIFRKFFGSPNPTQGWTRDLSHSIELDLDSDSLSGVPLGSAFENLKFLGPAQRSKSDPEQWEFVALGVVVEASDGQIVGFFVVPIPDEYFDVEPYTGLVTIGGRRVPIARISRERDVVRAFGEPARRDEDDDETVLFYDIGRVQRQIELTPDGRIKTISVFSYP